MIDILHAAEIVFSAQSLLMLFLGVFAGIIIGALGIAAFTVAT